MRLDGRAAGSSGLRVRVRGRRSRRSQCLARAVLQADRRVALIQWPARMETPSEVSQDALYLMKVRAAGVSPLSCTLLGHRGVTTQPIHIAHSVACAPRSACKRVTPESLVSSHARQFAHATRQAEVQ